METIKLIDHAKTAGAVKMQKVTGPNGAFISLERANGTKFTMPVGKKSQLGNLREYNVLVTPEGVAIATINNYVAGELIEL